MSEQFKVSQFDLALDQETLVVRTDSIDEAVTAFFTMIESHDAPLDRDLMRFAVRAILTGTPELQAVAGPSIVITVARVSDIRHRHLKGLPSL